MAGVFKLEITETIDQLKTLLNEQKTVFGKERVQALYLLKLGQVKTIQQLAIGLGRDRTTVQRWLRQYRQGGIDRLLQRQVRLGRKPNIPSWAQTALIKRLSEPEGFKSYGEIKDWLDLKLGVSASYKVVHDTVRYRLKAKLKRPRPQSLGHNLTKVEAFKKTCPST
jgi:putative transposase